MSAVAELHAARDALVALGPALDALAAGTLDDSERTALDVGAKLLVAAEVLARYTGDPTARAALGMLSTIPFDALARLAASWRELVARVERLDVEIAALGEGVGVTRRE